MLQTRESNLIWWTNYKNHVWGCILNTKEDDTRKVSYWRNEVFCNILTYLTPLSIIALIPSTFMAFRHGLAVVGFADLFTFLAVVIITVVPGIKLEIRKSVFILLLYCLSLVLLYYLPLPGPGLLFALSVTIFSSLIYSSSAAYASAWINTFLCICFALFMYSGGKTPGSRSYSIGAWIAVSSNLILLSFACAKCLDLLLTGLTLSLKGNAVSERKLEKANRLYRFISQINQSIVHIKDEKTLFHQSCEIAFTTGKFQMAWIGKFDDEQTVFLTNQKGLPEKSLPLFSASYDPKGPQDYVLRTGSHYVCNDVDTDSELESWKRFATANKIRSCIILPIKKGGLIIGSFNLYSAELNFFDEAEIDLLKEVTGDISFALDVFEKEKQHKLAEELIFKNENRFRSLIEKSKDVKTLTNKNGQFIYGSPSLTKLFDYSLEEFLNKSAFNFFHPDDLPHLLENIALILDSPGKSFGFQYRVAHKNGTWIWCEGTLTNLLHEPGIHAFVSNFRDITERKEAEREKNIIATNLQRVLTDLQKTMDSSLDIICSIDEEGRFVNVSKAATSILGFQPEELVGRRYIDMICEDDVEKTHTFASKIIGGHPIKNFENRYIHKDGSCINILWSATWDASSKLMYCIAKDITERKKNEDEKEKVTADLVLRSKNLEQFSYIVSHNLRAPVANILGFAELLKFENPSAELVAEAMKGMSIAAYKLDEVIKDMNEILHLRTLVVENREEVFFKNLVEDISISIDSIIKKEQVIIQTNFESADKLLSVKSYLYSIFYNLIINSIKFHKPGVSPLIEITSVASAKGIKLLFKDNGLGIDLGRHDRKLFGLYHRFHSHIEGKGMGLFMIKTQVETLGGRISLMSEVNKGTEFIIEFEN